MPELKNKEFKAPITHFLISNKHPIKSGDPEKVKKGFNVVRENFFQKAVGYASRKINK